MNQGKNVVSSMGWVEARAGIEPTYKDLQFSPVNSP